MGTNNYTKLLILLIVVYWIGGITFVTLLNDVIMSTFENLNIYFSSLLTIISLLVTRQVYIISSIDKLLVYIKLY